MAGIGDDIKEVLSELGTTVTIHKRDGSTFIEKLDLESYPTHSSEFVRQFFNSATLFYDTEATQGDLLQIGNGYFIITNAYESTFEDSPVDKTTGLYMCNVLGIIKRETKVVNPTTYIKEKQWIKVPVNPSEIHGLQYENKFGMEQLFAEDVQALLKEKHVLILPAGYDVKIDDRWYPDVNYTTEYYRVTAIETRRLAGNMICTLGEDSR